MVVGVVDITEGLGLLVAMAVLIGSIVVVLSLSEAKEAVVVAAVLLGDGDLLLFFVALSDMAAPLSVLSLRDS